MNVRELVTYFGFEADDKALDKIDKGVASVKRGLLAAAAAATAMAGATVAVVRGFANAGDEAAKGAARIGLQVEEYQELDHALQLAGSSIQQAGPAFSRLARAASDAADGSAGARRAFSEFGIAVTDTEGRLRPVGDLFEDVADAIASHEDPTRAAARAQELLGRGAKDLLPLMMQGSEGIRSAREEARLYGAVIDEEAARQSEHFNDQLFRLGQVVRGVRNAFGRALLPVFSEYTDRVHDAFMANRELIRERVDAWAREAAARVRDLIDWIRRTGEAVARLVERLGGLNRIMAALRVLIVGFIAFKLASVLIGVVSAVVTLTRAFRAAGIMAAAANAKMVLIPLAIAAIGTMAWLVWDDLVHFFRGQDSFIGHMIGRWRDAGGVLGWFANAMLDARDHGATALTLMANDVRAWGRITGAVFDGIMDRLRGIFQASLHLFTAGAQAATGRFRQAADSMRASREALTPEVDIGGRIAAIRAEQDRLATATLQDAARRRAERAASMTVDLDVNVDASGTSDPRAVGAAVAESVDDQMSRVLRQAGRTLTAGAD